MAVAGTGLWQWYADGAPTPSRAATGPVEQESSSATAAPPAELPQAQPARTRPGAPLRVRVPRLGVDAPVDPVGAPGGTLTPPSDATRLGWWAAGARPGQRGSVLVAGHTVSTGGGALDDLELLRRGDDVVVRTTTGRRSYEVVSVQVLGKGVLARRAQQLFDQRVPSRLVLVTCEDWDGTAYRSNVVVTARPRR
nr:class F sortase [Nocardioides perillae]